MIDELFALQEAGSVEEMREKLGAFLGCGGPVPEAAMRRFLDDPDYARNLLACRNAPGFLNALFQDPKNAQYAPPPAAEVDERSNFELLSKAAKAFWQWGKAGFSTVDQATYDRRLSACQRCPNLIDPPNKALYNLARAGTGDDRICKACGCTVARKARLPSETCPVVSEADPRINRWGEPVPSH